MKKHLLILLMSTTAMVATQPAWAQSVVAGHDAYGHPVYTDQDDVKPTVKAQPASSSSTSNSTTGTSSRYSGLVYWSNKDHRWKPVPSNNSSIMQAARKAAAEVDSMVLAPASLSRKSSRGLTNSQPVVLGSGFSNQSF